MKRFITMAVALLAITGLVASAAWASNDTPEGPNGEHQVVVCKYVGTPGPDERLQTGQNPIVVDEHGLLGDGFTGVFPFDFSDAQGRSEAIRWAESPQDGSITECPGYVPPCGDAGITTEGQDCPPVEPVEVAPIAPTFTPATCDSPGEVTVPEEPEGVLVDQQQEGDVVTVTFSAADGYTLGEAQTVYTFNLTDGSPTGGCGGGGCTSDCGPPPVCTEDMPCWDCRTMGNHHCGHVHHHPGPKARATRRHPLPYTGLPAGLVALVGSVLLGSGLGLRRLGGGRLL